VKRLALAAVLMAATAGMPAARAAAKSKATKPSAGKQAAAKKATTSTKGCPPAATAKALPPKEEPTVTPGSKVATFAFTNDAGEAVRKQVHHVLKSKGLKIDTSLRPLFDNAEQFRDTATQLALVGYIDGEVESDRAGGSATIFFRDASTGLRSWSFTFTGDRRQLPATIGKQLWEQLLPAVARASAALAAGPRKLEREPLRINAGTPLQDPPPEK
jgi:hypothetical protein